MSKLAVVLVNLGTPDAPTPKAVGKYLRQFLMDKYVIDILLPARFFLVNGIIVPFRAAKSAEAYKAIWTQKGSPLKIYSEGLQSAVQMQVGEGTPVHLAMRYGSPSIASVMEKLRAEGTEQVFVMPLYPQYALSSTETCQQEFLRHAGGMTVSFLPDFYQDSDFIDSWAAVYEEAKKEKVFDHFLFSFHGIPEHHLTKIPSLKNQCLKPGCCESVSKKNAKCYRAQCYVTARLIADKLGLSYNHFTVSFQSRLGNKPWIKPYTDHVLDELADKGIKRLAVFCPAFVADCLETLEEIGMRAREQFIQRGGEDLVLIPSLNVHQRWVQAVAGYVEKFRLSAQYADETRTIESTP